MTTYGPAPQPAVSTDARANVLVQALCSAMTSVGSVGNADVQEARSLSDGKTGELYGAARECNLRQGEAAAKQSF